MSYIPKSKLFKTLFIPVVISSITTGLFFPYIITKMQINQQYNQALLLKRQQLIEDAVKLSVQYLEFDLMWTTAKQNHQNLVNLTKKVIMNNQEVALSSSEIEDKDRLLDVFLRKDSYNISKLDQLKYKEYEEINTKITSKIPEKIDYLMEQYHLLSTMSNIYFGPETKQAFNTASDAFSNKSEESAGSFHGGLLIVECQKAMLSELNYNLK